MLEGMGIPEMAVLQLLGMTMFMLIATGVSAFTR